MFERLGSVAYRFRFPIVAAWVAAGLCAVLLAPSLASEGMTNPATFLPAGTSSLDARAALERAFPGATATSSATLSFSRPSGLTDADRAYVASIAAWVTGPAAPDAIRSAVTAVATAETRPELASMLRSGDGRLELVTLNLNVAAAGGAADEIVSALRAELERSAPDDLQAHVTGTAAISSDYLAAIVRGTDSTTVVTILLVVVILLLIYRAPLAAMVPLITIGMAFLVSRGVLGLLAAAGWRLSSLLDTFVVVLVFGVGTDYAIFLISRYREEVAHDNTHEASRTTVRRIGAVISASAATVIVGLGSMAFAEFGMIQTMGPALAVAIFVTLIAGLTLTPALLAIFGHFLFWPRHARTRDDGANGGFFARLASAVSRRPGLVTLVLLVALVVPATFTSRMATNFDVLSELPADSDARAGFDQIADHLGKGTVVQSTGIVDAGAGSDMLTPAALAGLRDVSRELLATPGVATVTTLVSPYGNGLVPAGFRPSSQLSLMADGFAGEPDSAGAVDARALLGDEATAGLDRAREYLALLGGAFPDAAATTDFRGALDDLTTARSQVQRVQDNAVIATQLRTLVRSMTSGSAAAGGDTDSVAIIGDYLDELGSAVPAARELAAFDRATAAAARLKGGVSIPAAVDLASGLSSLETWFVDHDPTATLVSTSLARTTEAKRQKAEIQATFDALPVDLRALASAFSARRDDIFVPLGLSGSAGDELRDEVAAFVSAGSSATRLWLTTTDDPYAQSAFDTVRRSQEVLASTAGGFGPSASAFLGGPTAEFADVQAVLGHDFQRVAIVTVLGVLLVLVILLRAVVAPLFLVATVLLSCATTLGLSAWVFQSVLNQSGVSFYLPLIMFVLLVALGSDYNIFLMSRVREESERRPIREGIRVASGRTGAVITSAGLILAGTFGSMATAQLTVLFQVGLAVAAGVLIDTFVVRSILVPAITTVAGDRAWWPSGMRTAFAPRAWRLVTAPGRIGLTAAPAGGRPRRWAALAMVSVVPMVVTGLFASSLGNPTAHLDAVSAAIVNEDLGAITTTADGVSVPITLGADLSARLASGAEPATFAWVVVSSSEAGDGLASGRFGAVLTIPADFSATIARLRASGLTDSSRATLRLETNDGTNYQLGTIAQSLSAAITASTAESVTASYVDDVLLSVTSAHDRMAGAAAEASRAASGATDLAAGAGSLSASADQLVASLSELADGTDAARAGVDQLASGLSALAGGSRSIASGTADLADASHLAAAGTSSLATGADRLADGLATLAVGTAKLPHQATTLASGASDVAAGAQVVLAGSSTLDATLANMRAATTGLGDEAAKLDQGAAKLVSGVDSLAAGAGQLDSAAGVVATGSNALEDAVSEYAGGVAALADTCAALGGSDVLCARLAELAAGNAALNSAAADVAEGSAQVDAAAGNVSAGASGLRDPAAQLRDATRQLAATAPQLETGIGQAAAGAASLASGAGDLAAAADQLAAGASTFATSAPDLTRAVAESAAGARTLADGGREAAAGAVRLAAGADRLAHASRSAADGAEGLAAGTGSAAGGAADLTHAIRLVTDGARLVRAGADGLAQDGQTVSGNVGGLATGLETDAQALPTWSAADRDAAGRAVADPIQIETDRLHPVAGTGAGLAPYFMGLALGMGALTLFLVLPAILTAARRSRWWVGPVEAFLAAAAVAIAQALLVVVGLALVGVQIARPGDLIAFAVLAAVVFVAMTQAFVTWAGNRGWLLALFVGILQVTSAGAPYPIETSPAFFQALHPLLPMTHAVEAFRTALAGGGPSVATAAIALGLWLVGSLAVTLLVARHRASAAGMSPMAMAPA